MENRNMITLAVITFLALAGLTALFATGSSTPVSYTQDIRHLISDSWSAEINQPLRERSIGERLKERKRFFWKGGGISDIQIYQDAIWLADYSSQQIHQVSMEGEILGSISQEGEAPWEHQGLNQISFRGDSVYSFDNLTMRLRGFSLEGEFGSYQEASGMFSNGTTLSPENALLLESDIHNGLSFICMNLKTGEVLNRLNIMELLSATGEVQYPDVALQGQLIPIAEGGAYFYCLKAGIIIRFDESGNPLFVNSTIDAKLPPKVSLRSSGDFLIYQEEPNYASNLSAAGSTEELLVLSNIRFSQGIGKRIDIYDGKSGLYQHSLEVPTLEDNILPIRIEMDGNRKLTILYEDQSLVTYKRQALMP